MQDKKVSVLIPAFNSADFIHDTLYSVINQSYKNIEVIVIDDGSTDDTSKIVLNFMDSRIKFFSQENKGCSSAKNTALKHSTGDYIQYLDSDDLLSTDKIYNQVLELKNNDDHVAVCRSKFFCSTDDLSSGGEIDSDVIYLTSDPFEFWKNLNGKLNRLAMVQPNAYLTPRSLIEKVGFWDESLSPSPDEDGEYFTRVLFYAKKIVISEGFNYYRIHKNNNSLSRSNSYLHVNGLINTIKKKFNFIFKYHDTDELKMMYAYQLSLCAYQFGMLYPNIISEIREELHSIGFNKFIFLHNSKFTLLARAIGFTRALFLKRLLNSVL